jgi:hypothetical protein
MSSFGPQHQLSAAEQRDGLAGLIADCCIPYLGGLAQMDRAGFAADDAVAGGAEMVAFEFDGSETERTFRQIGDAAVAATGVSQQHDRGSMQEAVGGKVMLAHQHPALRTFCVDADHLHAKQIGQERVLFFIEVCGAICHG